MLTATLRGLYVVQLRGKDSNLRPPGYEPDELPTALPRDNMNKEDKGFEPLRALTHLTVFKTVPFSRTWVILHIWMTPTGFEPVIPP